MGILRTQNHLLPYPDGSENVDVVTDVGELARAVDTALSGVAGDAATPVSLDDLTDVDVAGAPAVDGQGLLYDADTGLWRPGDYPAGGGATILDELGDVDTVTTPPAAGQALVFDGVGWVPATVTGGDGGTGGATALDGLTDVDTTTIAPIGGQVLTFDSATGLWHPAVAPAAEPASIDTHTDVDTTTTVPAPGQALVWNGSQWTPATVSSGDGGTGGATTIDELTDVDTTTVVPTTGQVLKFSDGQWRPAADTGATALDGLTDVDTTTVAPTTGQTLVYGADGQWKPGTVSTGGGAVQDTGWRSIALGSTWGNGYMYVRRVGTTVFGHVTNLNTTLTGNLTLWAVPEGFRMMPDRGFANVLVGQLLRTDDTGFRRVHYYSHSLKVPNSPTGGACDGTTIWATNEAWPTTLPGVAA